MELHFLEERSHSSAHEACLSAARCYGNAFEQREDDGTSEGRQARIQVLAPLICRAGCSILEPMATPVHAPRSPPGGTQSCPLDTRGIGLAASRQEDELEPYKARAAVLLALAGQGFWLREALEQARLRVPAKDDSRLWQQLETFHDMVRMRLRDLGYDISEANVPRSQCAPSSPTVH